MKSPLCTPEIERHRKQELHPMYFRWLPICLHVYLSCYEYISYEIIFYWCKTIASPRNERLTSIWVFVDIQNTQELFQWGLL